VSLSHNLTLEFSSIRDVTEGVLIYIDPPNPLNDSFEFEEGEEFENASELDMSITSEVEYNDLDESKAICF